MGSICVAASNAIGVLVADSNQMQCQFLASALRRRVEFRVAPCALEMDAILSAIVSSQVQVAIMNAGHPKDGRPEMTIVRRLHLAHPEVAKILLLDSYDREVVVNAFRSGAKGLFCLSEYPFRLLCKCIQSVHQGQVWANSEQLQYLIEVVTRSEEHTSELQSPCNLVCRLLLEKKKKKKINDRLIAKNKYNKAKIVYG